VRRLMSMAARVAERPAGKVTQVFSVAAEREGAFRFVENEDISAAEIGAAAHRATARRSANEPFVCVPVDQTDLRVVDRSDGKGLGPIGDGRTNARGMQVVDAIATTLEGEPLGMCAQVFWTRPRESKSSTKTSQSRPVEDKETMRWLEAMEQVRVAFAEAGVTTKPWFQIDRGGDAWPVMFDAKLSQSSWLTVRAGYSRRLDRDGEDDEQEYLWSRVERSDVLGTYDVQVPARPGRSARRATLQLQACPVTIDLQLKPRKQHVPVEMWAVRVLEMEPPGDVKEPIEWMLLTTFPVADPLRDAITVVMAYATRWRIEELHRTWKAGACHIEDSQLGERTHLERWATITASAAMRLLRLTYLSRTKPELPATAELSRAEIDAVILTAKPKGVKRGATPTIEAAVRWLASLGGYVGATSSGGPPGPTVIARGLQQIQALAQVLGDHNL
jgi:hypothetical protein